MQQASCTPDPKSNTSTHPDPLFLGTTTSCTPIWRSSTRADDDDHGCRFYGRHVHDTSLTCSKGTYNVLLQLRLVLTGLLYQAALPRHFLDTS